MAFGRARRWLIGIVAFALLMFAAVGVVIATIGTTLSTITAQGNGVTTSFPYPFLMPAAADAVVSIINANVTPNTTTVLTPTQYTVAGVGNSSGGSVTYPVSGPPLATGYFIVISRVLPFVQTTSISNQGPTFRAIEGALDYLMMIAQQLQAEITTIQTALNLGYVTGPLTGVAYVPSIAALRLNTAAYSAVSVQGATGPGTPAGGEYEYVSTDTTSADNGVTIIVDASGRRWYLRQLPGAALPVGAVPAPFKFRNLLVCGDASTCPDQRGNNFTGISNTGTMTLDFWEAIGGASSDIAVSNVGSNVLESFVATISVGRVAANADTHAINFGQVVDADRSQAIEGSPVCLSFWASKGANYSSASSLLTAKAYAGTDPYDGYASMVAGTWVGQTTILTVSAVLTSSPQRFFGCGTMPAGASANNEAETGINFSYTPSGTAGSADTFALWGVQYEPLTLGAGQVPMPTAFEHHSVDIELTDATFRAYVIPEPSAGVNVPFIGVASTSTTCVGSIPFPRIMRNVPTLTASAITPGTNWQAIVNGAAQNLSGIITATDNTYLYASVEIQSTGMSAGEVCGLRGNGGGAMLVWSVDLL